MCKNFGKCGIYGGGYLGQALKYDPNHLVNQGKPIQLEYWSWGDASTDPVYDMIKDYQKIYPNVKFKTKNVAWDDYWTKRCVYVGMI